MKADEASHDFQEDVTAPTYTSGGYTTFTCKVCGYSYMGDYTNELSYTIVFDLNGGSSASYVSSKETRSLSASDFFFDCKKSGYNFRGWSYNGVKVFDESGKQLFAPNMESTMTFVAVFANDASMSIRTNMDDAGTVSGDGYYEYNTDVNVLATPYQGYDFVGWYTDDGIILSKQPSYKYRMAEQDIVIEARFKLAEFNLSIASNDADLGTVYINPVSSTAYARYEESKSASITYTYDVRVAAYTKTDDIRFLGWFSEDNELVSTNAVYSFSMPNHDCYLEAKWNRFEVNYDLSGGVNSDSNPSSVSTEDETVLSNPTRDGYEFVGWYDKATDRKVDRIAAGALSDINLYAKWEPIQYKINYELGGNAQNASGNPNEYNIEQSVSLSEPTRPGYKFEGWYSDSSFSTACSSISIGSMGERSFYAKWTAVGYAITYNLNGGTNNVDNPESFNIEDSVVLKDPSRAGYEFKGWYSDSSYSVKVDSINAGTIGNISLYAKWSAIQHSLSITSGDESKGTVTISGAGYTDERITVVASPIGDWVFKGWYSGENLASGDSTYTFTMPASDYDLTAVFWSKAEQEEARRKALGIDPTIDPTSNTLTYGLYPQKCVSDSRTLALLNDLNSMESNGWYLLNGEYYAKKKAAPATSVRTYAFDDGTEIVSGSTYWFKCEPISWKILSCKDGEYFLLSSVLLDTHRFDDSSGNYGSSEIRNWLKSTFYISAFSLDDSLIQDKTINYTFRTSSNIWSESTAVTDKICLLDGELWNSEYGFDNHRNSKDRTRECRTTDWARANGASYDIDTFNGGYWRTSNYDYDGTAYADCAGYVRDDGLCRIGSPSYTNCVRPSITIKISNPIE